ncbi:MAG: ABC transporter permease [Defluviitaleaceae bacterium]|nr:ABC transporter permease [Defluviitaleaceae bacterium]
MIAIYKKEMRAYFTQMPGYVFLAIFLLLAGVFFTILNVRGASGNFHFVLGEITIFFFILIPTLTMRLFSEEARQKTDQLLFTSPLTVSAIVLGKFFAALSLFLLGTAATVILPVLLGRHGELPVSQIAGTYAGFFLLGAACIAIGVLISVLTENQIVAAVGTMAAVFVMFIMEAIALAMPTSGAASLVFAGLVIAAVAGIWYNSTRKVWAAIIAGAVGIAAAGGLFLLNSALFDGLIVRVLLWFSLFARFGSFTRGVLSFSDIVYYVSFVALFLYFTVNVIEKRRWR